MSVPYGYSLRSIRARWASSMVAVLGIAGVVAVFIAVMAMARGFQKMLVVTGSDSNAIILRQGATAEMMSVIYRDQFKAVGDHIQVARDEAGEPLVSGEVVVVAPFFHKASSSFALAQVRGVSPIALKVHPQVRVVEGRFFREGLNEFVVGRRAAEMYSGLGLGSEVPISGRKFRVVGIMESGGSLHESEVWGDARLLNECYKRPIVIYSSLSARLKSPEDFAAFKGSVSKDPRLAFEPKREKEFFEEQSRMMTTLIRVLGFLVAFVMGIGAVFAAFNTMYTSLASRTKEIATLRAIGFSAPDVIAAMLFEAVMLSVAGGLLGALFALPLNGFTASTLNFQSFSQVAFEFDIGPVLMLEGIAFAVLMGVAGGLIPAVRAARLKPADALRES